MSKAIFFINPFLGHIFPTVEIVRELIKTGEDIEYYNLNKYKYIIEKTGATFKSMDNFQSMFEWKITSKSENIDFIIDDIFTYYLSKVTYSDDFINFLDEQVKRFCPDYIVYDYFDCYWGKMIAKTNNIPAIALSPTFALCKRMLEENPYEFIKFIWRVPENSILYSWNIEKIKRLIQIITLRIKNIAQFEEFNMSEFGNSEILNIILSSRYFQPHDEYFDNTFRFVGYSFQDRAYNYDFNMNSIKEHEIVIYISLGTIINENESFYNYCFNELGDKNFKVILSAGHKLNEYKFKSIPCNFIVKPIVPQLDVLKRANVFITHGGMNSVTEGLYHNVPLIVMPQQGDGFAVADRVQELELGIKTDIAALEPGALFKIINDILSDEKYKINCKKIGEEIIESGGYMKAVDEILNFKNRL